MERFDRPCILRNSRLSRNSRRYSFQVGENMVLTKSYLRDLKDKIELPHLINALPDFGLLKQRLA